MNVFAMLSWNLIANLERVNRSPLNGTIRVSSSLSFSSFGLCLYE